MKEMIFCKDIGMFTINRPRSSCKHATRFCAATCYNAKLEKVFKTIALKDIKNEVQWHNMSGKALHATLKRKHNQTNRVRLMSRGEAFATSSDIDKVIDLLQHNPKTLFWIPTRAWRAPALRHRIENEVMPYKNARVQASLDPSNTPQELSTITNWSTMFYGDDQATDGRKLCPKTHDHKIGHCSRCRNGCFSPKQVHIHLKQH